jgi:hypothetical protein
MVPLTKQMARGLVVRCSRLLSFGSRLAIRCGKDYATKCGITRESRKRELRRHLLLQHSPRTHLDGKVTTAMQVATSMPSLSSWNSPRSRSRLGDRLLLRPHHHYFAVARPASRVSSRTVGQTMRHQQDHPNGLNQSQDEARPFRSLPSQGGNCTAIAITRRSLSKTACEGRQIQAQGYRTNGTRTGVATTHQLRELSKQLRPFLVNSQRTARMQ